MTTQKQINHVFTTHAKPLRKLVISHIANSTAPIPQIGYGGLSRAMAATVTFQAMSGHEVRLYAPADSSIIQFVEKTARAMKRKSEISEDGRTITITSYPPGKLPIKGTLTLRTTGEEALGYGLSATKTECNTRLCNLLVADETGATTDPVTGKALFKPCDIIHVHRVNNIPLLFEAGLGSKVVATAHSGTFDHPEIYDAYPYPMINISEADQNRLRSVPNIHKSDRLGVVKLSVMPTEITPNMGETAGYLVILGRIIEFRGQETAIEIARQTDKVLVIAGDITTPQAQAYKDKVLSQVDYVDTELFNRLENKSPEEIRIELERLRAEHGNGKSGFVIYIGGITNRQKRVLLPNAAAGLFPTSTHEAFGMAMAECLCAGTPIIGWAKYNDKTTGAVKATGSVRELIQGRDNGVLIDADTEEGRFKQAVDAVNNIAAISRATVRKRFILDLSTLREVRDLELAYYALLNQKLVGRYYDAVRPGGNDSPHAALHRRYWRSVGIRYRFSSELNAKFKKDPALARRPAVRQPEMRMR